MPDGHFVDTVQGSWSSWLRAARRPQDSEGVLKCPLKPHCQPIHLSPRRAPYLRLAQKCLLEVSLQASASPLPSSNTSWDMTSSPPPGSRMCRLALRRLQPRPHSLPSPWGAVASEEDHPPQCPALLSHQNGTDGVVRAGPKPGCLMSALVPFLSIRGDKAAAGLPGPNALLSAVPVPPGPAAMRPPHLCIWKVSWPHIWGVVSNGKWGVRWGGKKRPQ